MTNRRLYLRFSLLTRVLFLVGILILILSILLLRSVTLVSADIAVCGPISSDETWTPGNNDYIVTCDVQVQNGVTLTIQPGVIVKFDI